MDDRQHQVSRLQAICSGIIEELAALGGEQSLFTHYQKTVADAAARREPEDLKRIWSDLRDWCRILSPRQREQVETGLRRRFGIGLAGDESQGARE